MESNLHRIGVFEKANESGIQVILTEHADIQEAEFQNNVIQRWNNGDKLIPEDWYNESDIVVKRKYIINIWRSKLINDI